MKKMKDSCKQEAVARRAASFPKNWQLMKIKEHVYFHDLARAFSVQELNRQ